MEHMGLIKTRSRNASSLAASEAFTPTFWVHPNQKGRAGEDGG